MLFFYFYYFFLLFFFIHFLFLFLFFFLPGNSNQLLTASADNEVKLWSVEKGNNIDSWPHTNPVRSVMFAMGDKQFLTVTDQVMQQFPTVRIFDIRSSKTLQYSINWKTRKYRKEIWTKISKLRIRFRIAKLTIIMRIWCKIDVFLFSFLDSRKPVLDWQGLNTGKIMQAQWTDLNRSIITANEDGTIRIYDTRMDKKNELQNISEHSKAVSFFWKRRGIYFSYVCFLLDRLCQFHNTKLEPTSLVVQRMDLLICLTQKPSKS